MPSSGVKNAIWIFGDQHRAQALSCNGDPNLNTPNIDRLSAEGQNYERAVSGFPLCCPYRGSLLTSRYPHECVPGHEYPIPPEMPTVADVFNDHGFDTAYFGKWHLGGFKERDGRAAMYIIPLSSVVASTRGLAMRTTTANGTVGFTAEKAPTRFITVCRAMRPTL